MRTTLDRRRSAQKKKNCTCHSSLPKNRRATRAMNVRYNHLNPHRGRRGMRAAARCVCEVPCELSHGQEQNRTMRTVPNSPQGNVIPEHFNPKPQTLKPHLHLVKVAAANPPSDLTRQRPATPARGRLLPADDPTPSCIFLPRDECELHTDRKNFAVMC